MADNLTSQEDRIIQLSGLIDNLYTDYNKQIQDLITKLNNILLFSLLRVVFIYNK